MPDIKRPLKVFLSYASQDKSVVQELSRRLIDEGWIDVWLDVKKLLPGQDWRTKIEEAVETSDIVIICLSSNSVTKEGYVQKELRYAREIALEKPEETIFLIPMRLDDCEVPRGLRFYQWVDYFGEKKEESYSALIESLKLRYEQRLELEEVERARKEKLERETAERIAQEKVSREKAEREATEKARLESEELARQKAAREKAERELQEKPKPREAKLESLGEKTATEISQQAPKNTNISSSQPKSGTQTVFWVVGLVAVVALVIGLSSLNNPPPTPMPTSTRTTIPEVTVTASQKPEVKITPTQLSSVTLTPSPTKNVVVTKSPNTLYFISGDKHLNALDTLSGDVQRLLLLENFEDYMDSGGIFRGQYSTFFWLNDSEIAVWSPNELLVVNLLTNTSENITPNNFNLGNNSSDVSNDGKIIISYGESWEKISFSWTAIDRNGNLTNPRDVGINSDGYRAPFCLRWSPNGAMMALNISELEGGTSLGLPDLAILGIGAGAQPVIIQRMVDGCISWSPDGKYIVYGNGKLRNKSYYDLHGIKFAKGIYHVDVLSGSVTKLSSTDGYNPVWSTDGNTVAFVTDDGVSLIDVKTKKETLVYSGSVLALLWGK